MLRKSKKQTQKTMFKIIIFIAVLYFMMCFIIIHPIWFIIVSICIVIALKKARKIKLLNDKNYEN